MRCAACNSCWLPAVAVALGAVLVVAACVKSVTRSHRRHLPATAYGMLLLDAWQLPLFEAVDKLPSSAFASEAASAGNTTRGQRAEMFVPSACGNKPDNQVTPAGSAGAETL